MPFANPLHDPAKRLIRFPTVQSPDAWPKAPSQYVSIFEAVNVVGATLCRDEWTGKELQTITWLESPWSERLRMRIWRPRPVPDSISSNHRLANLKSEPIEHVKDWQAVKLNKDWEANSRAQKRLNRTVDWVAQKCRDIELTSFWRLRVGGSISPMRADEWNVDAPLTTFVIDGGNKRYCHELTRPGPWETFIFFEKRQLLDALRREPNAPLIVAEADLARLSPYLRLAVHVALQRHYFDRDSCETKDTREAEIEAAWAKFIPDIAPVKSTVKQLAKLMTFPNPEAIGQGQRGAQSRKSGRTPKE